VWRPHPCSVWDGRDVIALPRRIGTGRKATLSHVRRAPSRRGKPDHRPRPGRFMLADENEPGRVGSSSTPARLILRASYPTSRIKPVRAGRYLRSMPRISSFYGITILMFFGDHNPPHFHARYGEHSARIALDGTFLDGELPRRATRMVLEWTSLHSDELAECWDRAINHEPPGTIDPLP
jgi:hypothetical protein